MSQIGLLTTNCSSSGISYYKDCLKKIHLEAEIVILSKEDIKTSADISTLYIYAAITKDLIPFITTVEKVVVETKEDRLKIIALGKRPEEIQVKTLPRSIKKPIDKEEARLELGVSLDEKIIVSFGPSQASRGLDEVVGAIISFKQAGIKARCYILDGLSGEHDYLNKLREFAVNNGVGDLVNFVEGSPFSKEQEQYLEAADAFVINHREVCGEASAIMNYISGLKIPIVTSTVASFARYKKSVFHVTKGFSLPFSLGLVFESKELQKTMCSATPDNYPSVLILARENLNEVGGGDAVVIKQHAKSLRELGVEVDISLGDISVIRNYDIVNLYNFSEPETLHNFSKACVKENVPYVVTTFYEDWSKYAQRMLEINATLAEYLKLGQPLSKWQMLLDCPKTSAELVPLDNSYAACHAKALICSGKDEEESLRVNYPQAQNIHTIYYGFDGGQSGDKGQLFKEEYQVDNYVLCVGRLENRKNQLMLLKAFEESQISLVFLIGETDINDPYANACRAFKRQGPTYFINRVSKQMLASAYSGAKVHVLPSWCELPGLVSLEAAHYGTNVVCSNLGTISDYLGNLAYYCDPGDDKDILSVTMKAFNAQVSKELSKGVKKYTWEASAMKLLTIYRSVLKEDTSIFADKNFSSALTPLSLLS